MTGTFLWTWLIPTVVYAVILSLLMWRTGRYQRTAQAAIREAKRAQAIATALREVCQVAGIQVAITETHDGIDITAVHTLTVPQGPQETRH